MQINRMRLDGLRVVVNAPVPIANADTKIENKCITMVVVGRRLGQEVSIRGGVHNFDCDEMAMN